MVKKLFYILVFSISALQANTALAALNVSVDRNPVNIEDTFQITVEATEDVSGEPELDKLADSFDILGVSQSSSYQFGTGGNRRSIKRIITAQAKQAGIITIPSVQWDSLSSAPLSLKVLPAGKRSSSNSSFYVELSSSNDSPYVQGQVILTAKAFSNKQFGNGQFENPKMPDGLVAKRASSEDQLYKTTIDGVPHLVQERRFILYAERSGNFDIGSVLFQGHFATGRRDLFGQSQTVPKRVRSNGLSINVKAVPNGAKQPWLPAKQLTLSHYLSEGDFNVGEPITLTLSTIADGLMAEQIPDFDLALPKNLKAYPDQPEIDTNWSNGSVTAQRTDKIALIPTQPGHYKLPPIQLHWWNTQTDKAEVATIDGISFEVGGVAASTNTDSASTSPAPERDAALPEQSADNAPAASSDPIWKYLSAVLAAAWLITLLALILALRRTPHSKPVAAAKPSIASISKKQLLKSLKKAPPQEVAEQLVHWARGDIGSSINTIGQIIAYADKPLQEALEELNAQLYCAEASSWNSDKLIAALQAFELSIEKKPEQAQPKLYPE